MDVWCCLSFIISTPALTYSSLSVVSVSLSLSLSLVLLSFFPTGLAGLEHLCCLVCQEQYHYYIARNQNPFRWTEYTFSASLMRVMVAQFAGITDVHLLLVTFCLGALTMQLGSAHEVFNAKARSEDRAQNWICYYLAWVSQGISWAIIFNFFTIRVQQGTQPTFIWAIMIVMFLLDSSFALVFYLQWKKIGSFAGTLYGECGPGRILCFWKNERTPGKHLC